MSNIGLQNILDVTLRDGGYLNKWQFSDAEINRFIRFLHDQGLRNVEIGFLRTARRSTSNVNGCPVEFLDAISNQHPEMNWVGMLNPAHDDWREAVKGKLPYLSLVRLTCTEDVIDQALEIADYLHQHADSIKVSVNLICISSYHHAEIMGLLHRIDASASVDRVYFADSRGALLPEEIPALISLAKQHCSKPIGFHAHDTLGNAIENSNQAVANGCDLIDVSLNGFGLAGGNTPLAAYLTANQLARTSLELDARSFCEADFPLKEADMGDRALYRVLATKNVDPIWTNELVEKYSQNLPEWINSVPRQPYKTLQAVLDAFQKVTEASVEAAA